VVDEKRIPGKWGLRRKRNLNMEQSYLPNALFQCFQMGERGFVY
jgi:hypothetical protein